MDDKISKLLHTYFPSDVLTAEEVEDSLAVGEIAARGDEILRYLQTALFDEKIIEVELDGIPHVHFTRIKDDLPDLIEQQNEAGEIEMVEPEYEPGDYLRKMAYLVTLPLEPGMANLSLRHSRTIILRMFINTKAIELGTYFLELCKVRELPVLRLAYPPILKVRHDAREYRAKTPEGLSLILSISKQDGQPARLYPVLNVSVGGLAFAVKKEEQDLYEMQSRVTISLTLDDEIVTSLGATVMHRSKIRKGTTIEYVCGVQFKRDSRPIMAAIESLVATVQRAHLKELAALSEATGVQMVI